MSNEPCKRCGTYSITYDRYRNERVCISCGQSQEDPLSIPVNKIEADKMAEERKIWETHRRIEANKAAIIQDCRTMKLADVGIKWKVSYGCIVKFKNDHLAEINSASNQPAMLAKPVATQQAPVKPAVQPTVRPVEQTSYNLAYHNGYRQAVLDIFGGKATTALLPRV